MKKKKRSITNIIILVLIILICFVSIGYSSLETNLNVGGVVEMKKYVPPKIIVNYTNNGGANGWSTSKEITIKVVAEVGLSDNASVSYGFSTNPSVIPTDMQTHYFENAAGVTEVSMKFMDTSGKNGAYYLFVDGKDIGAADVWTDAMKFDNVKPATPIINNPHDNRWVGASFVNAGNYVLNISSTDSAPGSGISYYQYRYPNSESNWDSYSNSATNNFTTTPFTLERDEDVEIRACDYANNCSDGVRSRIKIDKTNPACSISLNGTIGENGWYKTNGVAVSLTTNDSGGSSVHSYDLTTSWAESYNGNAYATQWNTAGVTYYGYVKDNAGNVGRCSSASFKVDTTAPICSIGLQGAGGTDGIYNSNVVVTLYTSDGGDSAVGQYGMVANNSSVNYNWVNSTVQGQTSGVTYYGFVKDNAGNTGSCNSGYFKVVLSAIPVFGYDGIYQIVDDNDNIISDPSVWTGNWKIRFLTSGTLNVSSLNTSSNIVDVFLVGGGGGGSSGKKDSEGTQTPGTGGAGGYTQTATNIYIALNTNYYITVGAGGAGGIPGSSSTQNGGTGGASNAFGITANGGGGGSAEYVPAPNGGSGAGARGYWTTSAGGNGGTDGGNGGKADRPGGIGQGTTTREFGNPFGRLYAGGGGGGSGSLAAGVGGAGGGGNGGKGTKTVGTNGEPNSGGGGGGGGQSNVGTNGGAGGSGIVIIRNKR